MSGVVDELITIMTHGFGSFASGIGDGLNAFASNIFLTTTGEGANAVTSLSVFGGLVAVFAAIGLTIGISRLVVRWVTSLGGSRM